MRSLGSAPSNRKNLRRNSYFQHRAARRGGHPRSHPAPKLPRNGWHYTAAPRNTTEEKKKTQHRTSHRLRASNRRARPNHPYNPAFAISGHTVLNKSRSKLLLAAAVHSRGGTNERRGLSTLRCTTGKRQSTSYIFTYTPGIACVYVQCTRICLIAQSMGVGGPCARCWLKEAYVWLRVKLLSTNEVLYIPGTPHL